MPVSRIFTEGKNWLDRKPGRNCEVHEEGDWDCETLGGREREIEQGAEHAEHEYGEKKGRITKG